MGETTSGADDKGGSFGGKGDSGPSYGASSTSYGDAYGGSAPSYYDPGPAAAPATDYSYASPDFGSLDYLSTPTSSGGSFVGEQSMTTAPGGWVDGYGLTDLPGMNLPGSSVGPDTFLPPGAMPSDGPAPDYMTGGAPVGTPITGGTPAPAFSFESLNYQAPAGSAATPNVSALNASPLATIDNPMAGASAGATPGGTSAVGGLGGAAAGGGGDLSARGAGSEIGGGRRDDSWLKSLGINNPVGTALAAGGMGYNMFQSKAMADALKASGAGPNSQASLAAVAAPAAAQGRQLTQEGQNIVTNQAQDLATRAQSLDPNAQTLQNRGTGLTGYVGTGTLPPEMMAQVEQGVADAKAKLVSEAAARGMPTNPARNSQLAQRFEELDRQRLVTINTLAQQLATTGNETYRSGLTGSQQAGAQSGTAGQLGANLVTSGAVQSGLAATTYNQLANLDEAQTKRTQEAIARMAAALNGQSVSQNVARTAAA